MSKDGLGGEAGEAPLTPDHFLVCDLADALVATVARYCGTDSGSEIGRLLWNLCRDADDLRVLGEREDDCRGLVSFRLQVLSRDAAMLAIAAKVLANDLR